MTATANRCDERRLAWQPSLKGVGMWMASAALAVAVSMATAAFAQAPPNDNRPYDNKLLRLSEILGAVHFLRELCGANDGMMWRDRMAELINAESSSALRRVKLTRAFNAGYRSYSRTYTTCTPTAQSVITKFMAEATGLADDLVKTP